MAIQNTVNFGGLNTMKYADSDADAYDRATQMAAVAYNLDNHDHSSGKGLGVLRVQTASAPASAGQVRVNADTFQWWAATAAAVYTAVSLEGTQTITGAKTFSAAATFGSTINGQTISAAASFTGTLTVAGGVLTVTKADVSHVIITSTEAAGGSWRLQTAGTPNYGSGAGTLFLRDLIAGADRLSINASGGVTINQTLAIGTNPAATGTIRLPYAGLVNARNSGNTADGVVLQVSAANELTIGGATFTNALFRDLIGSSQTTFGIATSTVTTLNIASGGTVTNLAGILRVGTSIAGSAGGVLTVANGLTITAGALTFGGTSAGIIAGPTSFVINNNANTQNNVVITDAGAVTFRSTVDGITTLSATTAVQVGATPATTGTVRLANAATVTFRNAANSANFQALSIDASNQVVVGDNSGNIAKTIFYGSFGTMFLRNGLVVGSATGGTSGDMGLGTVNVQTNVYLNGTAYTNPDFVFEAAFTGKVEKHATNPGYTFYRERYGSAFPTLAQVREYAAEHHRFPLITDAPMGLFTDKDNLGRDDVSLILHEQEFVYLFGHEDRIAALETKIAAMEAG